MFRVIKAKPYKYGKISEIYDTEPAKIDVPTMRPADLHVGSFKTVIRKWLSPLSLHLLLLTFPQAIASLTF